MSKNGIFFFERSFITKAFKFLLKKIIFFTPSMQSITIDGITNGLSKNICHKIKNTSGNI